MLDILGALAEAARPGGPARCKPRSWRQCLIETHYWNVLRIIQWFPHSGLLLRSLCVCEPHVLERHINPHPAVYNISAHTCLGNGVCVCVCVCVCVETSILKLFNTFNSHVPPLHWCMCMCVACSCI